MTDDLEYMELLDAYEKELVAYGERYNVDVQELLKASRAKVSGGYNTVCKDGWVSSSGGKQGACSHHSGLD